MKYCIVCKQEYISGTKYSFYNFPKEGTINRTKWLLAVGRDSVPKHTYICSMHFDATSFVNNDYNVYSQKKRLKPNAVPCLTLSPSSSPVDPLADTVQNPTDIVQIGTNHNVNEKSTLGRASTLDWQKTTVKAENLQIFNYDINDSSNLDRTAGLVFEKPTVKTEDIQISDSDHNINEYPNLDNILNRATSQDWTIKSEDLQISDSDFCIVISDSDRSETEDTEKSTGYYENEISMQVLKTNHKRTRKRKLGTNDGSDNRPFIIPYKKKLHYKNYENESRWLDGNDILFKTQQSYDKFEEFIAFLKRRVQCYRQRSVRSEQKVRSLEKVIQELNTKR